ncbi:hypothetical protein ALC53_01851 [Atta colombica]|uniref:Uncharacterized protein n=1 Tax=Atta colombica TaxID=520822 RepID=A0A151I641_9HYME|nr:hypothetical protein ALC53_01851 [Atta colombica]
MIFQDEQSRVGASVYMTWYNTWNSLTMFQPLNGETFQRLLGSSSIEIQMFNQRVPEPALSEPAQQLIGARSGGERGYYRTTTPRFGEIQSRVV